MQKTACELRFSDWSSDVCSSDLEQIQDTAKRIKRLGESSQEIGDIVSLIDDIADQTNILALNAAIQEIGRASCTERVRQYVYVSVVAVSLRNNKDKSE